MSVEHPSDPEAEETVGNQSDPAVAPSDNAPKGDDSKPKQKARKSVRELSRRRGSPWSRLSYAARVTISFSLIAAMTALAAIGVVSIVWEQHFQTYTQDNMRAVAETTANQIAELYEQKGAFTDEVLQPAENTVAVTHGVGVQVVDADNKTLFDSSTRVGGVDGVVTPSMAPQQGQANIAHAPIIADDQAVGSVRVWVYGSDKLLRSTDQEFRDKSYQALIIAAVVAILLASVFGFFFARNLVKPVQRMTETAVAIKEGNLKARTNLKGEDEISQLGQTFDEMAATMERDRQLERRLTTDVAHELRTPLMAIQSTVEAMVDGVLPVDEERLLTVDSEVMRLSRLVDQMLKLSRLENRSNPNKQELLDAAEVVAGVVATHEAYVRESGLAFEFETEEDLFVIGDADLIRQAVANLISNAVRYTDEGGTISVRVVRGGMSVRIEVKDTGIGLTPEEANMVLQRFWRAEEGRDRVSGGLGVGLAIVDEIAKRHGGKVEVDGRKGEGSTFTLCIPLHDPNQKSGDDRKGSRMNTGRISRAGR